MYAPSTIRDAMHVTPSALVLILITLLAAIVNGALGYGFSSITVPLALLFYTNRVLNPALVWIEVVLNAYVLWVNRASVPHVWRRVVTIILGLAPGVVLGTSLVHRVPPGWLKLATFMVLLPLILLQAAGFRRPIKAERPVGLAFGGGLGVLYSVTTISGPPACMIVVIGGEIPHQLTKVRAVESKIVVPHERTAVLPVFVICEGMKLLGA